MSLMITPTNPAAISLAAGQSLVVKDMSGVSSLSPATITREDASVRIGAGFFVYGPATADASFTLSTTGQSFCNIVQGDPTPADRPLLFDPGNPPTSGPTIPGDGAAAVKRASGASGQGIKRVLVAGHSFAMLHGRTETNTLPSLPRGYSAKAFVAWACMRVRNRAQLLGHAGVGGELLPAFLSRLNDVIARAPDICVLVHGLNDLSLSASARPLTAILADLVTCWERMRSAGITVIATTVTTINAAYGGTHTARRAEVPLLNDMILSYCAQNGIYCADIYSATIDANATTGDFSAGYSYDNLHLDAKGAWAASKPVAEILDQICPPRAGRVSGNYDQRSVSAASNQLLNNPMLYDSSLGVGVASQWEVVTSTGSPAVTLTKVTLPDGTPGQRIQLTAAAAASVVLKNTGTPLTARLVPGGIYRAEVDAKIDANSLCNRLDLELLMTADGVEISAYSHFPTTAPTTNYDGIVGEYTPFVRPVKIPESTASLTNCVWAFYVGVAAGGNIDITLSRAEVRRIPEAEVFAV